MIYICSPNYFIYKEMKEKDSMEWKVLSSQYISQEPWFTVRKEKVQLPNGNTIDSYYVLEYPNWVNVIAITKDGKFIFERQYRHGLRSTSYELCAGVCEKEDSSPFYKVIDCRVQTARTRKGMPLHPCKSVGIIEYSYFAKEIDPRFDCETISCFPDITDPTCACCWKFTLQNETKTD